MLSNCFFGTITVNKETLIYSDVFSVVRPEQGNALGMIHWPRVIDRLRPSGSMMKGSVELTLEGNGPCQGPPSLYAQKWWDGTLGIPLESSSEQNHRRFCWGPSTWRDRRFLGDRSRGEAAGRRKSACMGRPTMCAEQQLDVCSYHSLFKWQILK